MQAHCITTGGKRQRQQQGSEHGTCVCVFVFTLESGADVVDEGCRHLSFPIFSFPPVFQASEEGSHMGSTSPGFQGAGDDREHR